MKPRLKKLRLYPLDTVDANADRVGHVKHPLISTHVELHASTVVLNPNVEEVQQLMQQLIGYVVNVFHGVRKWGEVRTVDAKRIHEHPAHDFTELLPNEGNSEIEKFYGNENGASRQIQQGANRTDVDIRIPSVRIDLSF